ncbi:hypothetical protein [Halomarina oriensis]|uniref:Uncharacterized protein n=1 Tax=Halomarina oriensis TaxID=671145 RepID=A0A6B0GVN4_9EURY|nr:hypothetical protein [Halomarina oriensis]MWG35768.1 hypothetical protein [Halomarina oriensis]
MPDATVVTRSRRTVGHTRRAVAFALSRRDGVAVFGVVTAAYLLAYLVVVGHLGPGDGTWGVTVVSDPLSRALRPRGAFRFEPVAGLAAGPVRLLVAPLTLAVGGVLAALVGVNLSLSSLAVRQPTACGLSPSTGVLAAVPGLLSGAACCGPTVLLVLGVQASGLLLSAFSVLVPVSTLSLLVSLVLVGRYVSPGGATARDSFDSS